VTVKEKAGNGMVHGFYLILISCDYVGVGDKVVKDGWGEDLSGIERLGERNVTFR